ncbi:MAG: YceI family protein [Bacteroidetes bacterium]|nr:YceI family protein [Bacteroidota bacterium]MDA0874912.1 YceI family protein [Bacteroidota bacterium]
MMYGRTLFRAASAFLGLMLMVAGSVSGQAFQHDGGHVEFVSNVPLHSFTGVSDKLVGRIDLDGNTVDFYVDLNTLDTGNGKRDKDMRKTLDTAKYPFAEFFGAFSTLPDPQRAGPQDVEVSGRFTIHGVTKTIRVPGTATFGPQGLRIQAAWILRLDDYNIEPPSLLIIKVDDEQEISLDILLKPE